MKRTTLVVIAALSVAGCASKSAGPTPADGVKAEVAPAFDLEKERARELPEMAKQSFSIGGIEAEVEGAAAPTVREEEHLWTIVVPLAGASELHCMVYDRLIDPATVLHNMVNGAAANTEVVQALPVQIAAVEQTPAMFLDVAYQVPSEAGPLAGQMKVMVFPSDFAPLVCVHDEVGFQQTFTRITLGLARSLVAQAPAEPVRYAALSVFKLNGMPVAFEREVHVDGENGATVVKQIASSFLPRSATDFIAEDTVKTTVSDEKGLLVMQEFAQALNGELAMRVTTTREANGEYRYEGHQGDKELAGRFKATNGLSTDRGVARALRETLLSGKASEVRLQEYVPTLDPAGPLDTVYRVSDKAPRAVTAMLQELSAFQILDEHGYVERLEIEMGQGSMVGERISTRGAP